VRLEDLKVFWTDTVTKLLDLERAFERAAFGEGFDLVLFERYRLFLGKAHAQINSELYPVQVVGATRLLAYQHHVDAVGQEPHVKAVVSRDMEAWCSYWPRSEHERDCLRHVIYLRLTKGLDNPPSGDYNEGRGPASQDNRIPDLLPRPSQGN